MTENGMISVRTGISVMPLWDHQAGNGVISYIITASLWGRERIHTNTKVQFLRGLVYAVTEASIVLLATGGHKSPQKHFNSNTSLNMTAVIDAGVNTVLLITQKNVPLFHVVLFFLGRFIKTNVFHMHFCSINNQVLI